jgi:hypothetical protein
MTIPTTPTPPKNPIYNVPWSTAPTVQYSLLMYLVPETISTLEPELLTQIRIHFFGWIRI